jgi:predicted nucleic acid-binding protein
MSFDLGVWYPQKRIGNKEARELYARLCDSDASGVVPHPAINEFYAELTARHPELDTIREGKIEDRDHCPWSCKLDRSPGHVIMSCVWSKAKDVHRLVQDLAHKHGLAVYDPQADIVTYPDGSTGADKKASRIGMWILGSCSLIFAAIFVYSGHIAPSGATLALYILAGLCGVMAAACFRQARR